MKALKVVGVILLMIMVFFNTLGLLAAGQALSQAAGDSAALGRFMGSLLAEFVLLAVLLRLIRSLQRS